MQTQIDNLFNLLDKWRHFPSYQLERRADIFFALYLKEILQYKFKHNSDNVIPEFPIRRGTIGMKISPNKSKKVDYVSIDQTKEEVLLIELKTDISSKNDGQDDYLDRAVKMNIKALIDGVILIYSATNKKNKYNYLIDELVGIGWVEKDGKTFINTSKDYNIRKVYIQPDGVGEDIINFDDIINALEDIDDGISIQFCKSLENWKQIIND
jgi:hypothetical protein